MSPQQAQKPSESTRDFILIQAIPLFAQAGFAGVSMRDIAKAVGISAAALYHHFPDKDALYLEVIRYAFADKAQGIDAALNQSAPPKERLVSFVESLCHLMGNDPNFRLLIQRELVDQDESRLKVLAEAVFIEQFKAITDLAKELAPECDAHMFALSISGLVLHHFELGPLRRYFPGSRKKHEDPKYIAKHVTNLLLMDISKAGGDRSC